MDDKIMDGTIKFVEQRYLFNDTISSTYYVAGYEELCKIAKILHIYGECATKVVQVIR